VNRAHLRVGDTVLFRGGATFADDILMPGWGTAVSGAPRFPVVFASYGRGRAWLPRGIWFRAETYLVFEHLAVSGDGIGGSGSAITIAHDRISGIGGAGHFAINATGSGWSIRDNVISHIGDSGLMLIGDRYYVAGNRIDHTGLDPSVDWGAHGIYLKASRSTVLDNKITHFHNEGVSVRYRDSVIARNNISGGQYGIAWHQYDTASGTSYWFQNTITHTTEVGIYISPHDIGGYTHERFVLAANVIRPARGVPTDLETHSVRIK